MEAPDQVRRSIMNNFDYIRSEILATSFDLVDKLDSAEAISVEVDENLNILTEVNKYSNGH
jgi:hypothetical protein